MSKPLTAYLICSSAKCDWAESYEVGGRRTLKRNCCPLCGSAPLRKCPYCNEILTGALKQKICTGCCKPIKQQTQTPHKEPAPLQKKVAATRKKKDA